VTKGFTALTSPKTQMPSNGYWVIEKISENSDHASVYYYDNNDKMILTELIIVRSEHFLTNRVKRKLNKKLKLLLKNGVEENEGKSGIPFVTNIF
jgi:hypothetical protein